MNDQEMAATGKLRSLIIRGEIDHNKLIISNYRK